MQITAASRAMRRKPARSPQKSRVANGSALLPYIDGRSLWARRAREVLSALIADRGGAANVSEAENALIRRAVVLTVELELREAEFAQAGRASDNALSIYQTGVNTLRRLLESIGLERRARDVTTPTVREYLAAAKREGGDA